MSSINTGDTAWVLMSTSMVFLMVPGGALFYSGAVRSKNKLSILFMAFLAISIVSIEWYLWGYSLVFSDTANSSFIGNFDSVFLINVGNDPHVYAPSIPENVFMIYEYMFAAETAVLVIGSIPERTSIYSFCVFVFIWSTFVYNFIAYWVWGPNGFLRNFHVLDYAGGAPVHVCSGFASLAYALAVGQRKGFPNLLESPKTNIPDVFIGTALLWFGWFGFNGGSAYISNSTAGHVFICNQLAACTGGLTWVVLEMLVKRTKKMSLYGFCCGAIVGLVSITPAAAYVPSYSAIFFGLFGSVVSFSSTKLYKIRFWKCDDSCDVFAVHGMGGIVGLILTGVFADKSVVNIPGETIDDGWINGNVIQVLYQITACVVAMTWSFVLTFIIVKIMNCIPFLKLRVTENEEESGIDWSFLGEQSYGHDIVVMKTVLNIPDTDVITQIQ